MPSTTSRLGLPYPLTSEPPNGPAQIGALANALDNAAIDLAEGLLSARPAPSIRGRWYYATDVGILYRDSGSTWRVVGLAPDVVTAAHILDGTITNAEISASAAIAESKLALASDAAAGTPSRRTLGTGATQAAAGNDSRFGAAATPTDGSVTLAKLAASVAEALWKTGDVKSVAYAVSAGSEDSGWLLCDGRTVSRTTYSALFAKVSTLHGAGDGSSTFNLPDYRGRALVGRGTNADVDTVGKSDNASVGSRTPWHNHLVPAHDHGASTGSSAPGTNSVGDHSHSVFTDGETGHTFFTSPGYTPSANTGIGHNHGGGTSANGGHSHSVNSHAHTISSQAAVNTDLDTTPFGVVNYLIKT